MCIQYLTVIIVFSPILAIFVKYFSSITLCYAPIGLTSIVDFDKVFKKLDSEDAETEGHNDHNLRLKNYATIGHPYMRNYSNCPDIWYQLMSQ